MGYVVSPSRLLALVSWDGLSADDATWENWDDLKHDFNLEDKVVLNGTRNDMRTARQ